MLPAAKRRASPSVVLGSEPPPADRREHRTPSGVSPAPARTRVYAGRPTRVTSRPRRPPCRARQCATILRALAMDLTLGTPLSPSSTRLLLLGSGELGREVAIEAAAPRRRGHRLRSLRQRPGDAGRPPQPRVRHARPRRRASRRRPRAAALHRPRDRGHRHRRAGRARGEGWTVIPTARATRLTMDREGIRRLAAEQLGLPTSPYAFADTLEEVEAGRRNASACPA